MFYTNDFGVVFKCDFVIEGFKQVDKKFTYVEICDDRHVYLNGIMLQFSNLDELVDFVTKLNDIYSI